MYLVLPEGRLEPVQVEGVDKDMVNKHEVGEDKITEDEVDKGKVKKHEVDKGVWRRLPGQMAKLIFWVEPATR